MYVYQIQNKKLLIYANRIVQLKSQLLMYKCTLQNISYILLNRESKYITLSSILKIIVRGIINLNIIIMGIIKLIGILVCHQIRQFSIVSYCITNCSLSNRLFFHVYHTSTYALGMKLLLIKKTSLQKYIIRYKEDICIEIHNQIIFKFYIKSN